MLIGTFNAKFLPRIISDRKRARLLAQRIAVSEYDLMALQELMDHGARNLLVAELAPRYPHYVAYVGSHKLGKVNSGLALFSRFPFEVLPDAAAHRAKKVRASNDGGSSPWHDVAFVEFDQCLDTDCLAGKGAAYVRVRLPDRPLNVFWTHMQANYPRDDAARRRKKVAVRRAQLQQLRRLMEETLSPDRVSREDVVILGDFNIDGALLRDPELGEWQMLLEEIGAPFPSGIVDLWQRYGPAGDLGLTFPVGQLGYRYDCIFLSRPRETGGLSVRRVALADNLRVAAGSGGQGQGGDGPGDLSDHIGVNAYLVP